LRFLAALLSLIVLSLLGLARHRPVEPPPPELERVNAKLSMQRRMNTRILEVSDAMDPRNSSAPETLIYHDPASITVITVGIGAATDDVNGTSDQERRKENVLDHESSRKNRPKY
jgi:hypothetical protein